MQNSQPSEWFPGINFNFSYYSSGKDFVTKEYVDNNFLKAVGYAYSRAISTSFNGIIYALGGIETTNITATGTITSNLFSGSGAGLTSLNASNISGGTLGVNVGGTGQNVLPFNQILVGNGTDPVITSANLTYESNILSAGKFSGSGAELTNLNASYVTDGTLDVARGGTGASNFTTGRLLFGNGINAISNSGNLTWLTVSNALSITGDVNITGSYKVNNNNIVSSQWITSGTTIEYNAGSVGIGASALAYKLNVNGTTQTTKLTTTNLGIGVTNPTIPLHIYDISNSKILLDTTTTGTASIEFRRGTGFDIQQDFRFINDTDSTLKLQYENNQQAYADSVAQLMWVLPNVTSGLLSVKMWKNTEFVGNIGVGKLPSDTYKIDVNGSINATSVLINGVNITGSKWTTSGTNIYYNLGNVGIGTNNPLALLDVVYSPPSVANTDMFNFRVDGNWGLKLQQSYTQAGNIQYNLIHRYNATNYNLLTFKGTNVGINTTSPQCRLHIVNSSTALNPDSGVTGIYVYNPTNSAGQNSVITNRIGGSSAGRVMYSMDVYGAYGMCMKMEASSHAIRFNNNWEGSGTDILTINGGGGINVNNYIISTSYVLGTAIYARNGYDSQMFSSSGGCFIYFGDLNTGNNSLLEISASNSATNINSNSSRDIYFRTAGYRWLFQNNGYSWNGLNASNWSSFSDHRIKENIIKANLQTCYNNVKNISVYRFNYINGFSKGVERDKTQLGFIAQQVQQLFPKSTLREKIRIDDKREIPDLCGINVDQLNFTLFGAVKQLIKVVEKQSKRIKKLEELLNIIDNDEVEDDADEPYEKIECDEVDINTIEPSEPEGV